MSSSAVDDNITRISNCFKTGEVVELYCKFDPSTRGGNAPDGRKAKANMHWISASHALEAEVRLYDTLFLKRMIMAIFQIIDSSTDGW